MRPADAIVSTRSCRGMATVLMILLACAGGPAIAGDETDDIAALIAQLGDDPGTQEVVDHVADNIDATRVIDNPPANAVTNYGSID